jgi:DNA-3-methyladenine glycosylase II
MTPADYARARHVLVRRDPVLRALVRRYGACGLARAQRVDPFASLAEAIIHQQLSTKAAATIHRRFLTLFDTGQPEPARLAVVPDETLRAVGVSRQKIGYLRDLAARVLDGSVQMADLVSMDDERVIESLTTIKGIGRWSAQMFLIFKLHRPDVMPVGDLGIARAIERAYRLRKPPKPERMLKIAEAWRPYRSVACWYLWASLENTPLP